MIEDRMLVEFLVKLKGLGAEQCGDVLGLISDAAAYQDERGNPVEIAKTILEILEPERVGKVVMLPDPCEECGIRHEPGKNTLCWK